jgi:hypothetical protein
METKDNNESQDTVRLNGREVTREELQRQQEAAAKQKGADLKEVSKDEFRMRLQD